MTATKEWWRLPGVLNTRGNLYYRPRIPVNKRELVKVDKAGFLSPSVPLGKATDHPLIVIEKYRNTVAQLQSELDPGPTRHTLAWLYAQYIKSDEWWALAGTTRKGYAGRFNRLLAFPVETYDNSTAVVGELPAAYLTRPKIKTLYKTMLKEMQDRGLKGINEVNGRVRAISLLFTWALDTYEDLGFNSNPCYEMSLKGEKESTRYISDWEYDMQLEYVCSLNPQSHWLRIFFELAYLLASRSIEVRYLKMDDVSDLGILVERRKGSRTNIITWSDRLQAALYSAKNWRNNLKLKYPEKVSIQNCEYLLMNRSGRVRKEALGSSVQRLKENMEADGIGSVYWAPHDCKRKGISDAKDKNIAGHKSEAMKEKYDKKVHTHTPAK